MSDVQCKDLSKDRAIGEFWEREFCKLMARQGKTFTPLQIGRKSSAQWVGYSGRWHSRALPDVTVWTHPGEHHEIKHKTTNRHDSYGLERYRFEALCAFAEETKQAVMYTIHDHGGNRNSRRGIWLTANINDLSVVPYKVFPGDSWVNGVKKRVPIMYWPRRHWVPLLLDSAE